MKFDEDYNKILPLETSNKFLLILLGDLKDNPYSTLTLLSPSSLVSKMTYMKT